VINRLTWDEVWLRTAILIGQRSRCDRAQVGAVIVTADNRVDSCSYNGPIAALRLEGTCRSWCPRAQRNDTSVDYSTCSTIHAESNSLIRSNHDRIQGGTIYVSRAMCLNCAKEVCNSGLARVVHRVLSEDEHRNPGTVEDLIRSAGIEVSRVTS
jgi:dCMP deaminase